MVVACPNLPAVTSGISVTEKGVNKDRFVRWEGIMKIHEGPAHLGSPEVYVPVFLRMKGWISKKNAR